MTKSTNQIGILYEHPTWFTPLFNELEKRNLSYFLINASDHYFDPAKSEDYFSLVFNRMSASAYLREHGNTIFYTHYYLAHLQHKAIRVINGSKAFTIETSKALQLSLLDSLGLAYPTTRIVNSSKEIIQAAQGLSFPVIVKPNIGGRGAGIVRYDSLKTLTQAVNEGKIDLGIDSTSLVQEFIPARDGHIIRVETLNGKYLYAIKVYPNESNYNLCPAEICQAETPQTKIGEVCLAEAPKQGIRVEVYHPPLEIIQDVEKIVSSASIDVGGVEYLVDDRNGSRLFYDINALSNFVADAKNLLGFDPYISLVNYLEEEAQKCAMAIGYQSLAVG